ncbi:MAG: hypothetical protein methR_P0875 [Methyloprofundus sp.]|nr:MAG: hypothetical protein methR_P0875 [Methyloprofundus sp.]
MKLPYTLLYSLTICLISACTIQKQPINIQEQAIISWRSPEGIQRLAESNYKIDFFTLANHFESQHNKLFCGPASAAIVLNSLRIRNSTLKIPQDTTLLSAADLQFFSSKTWSPFFERYTQNNIFMNSPKSRALVLGEVLLDEQGEAQHTLRGKPRRDRGFQVRQLAELFLKHDLTVKIGIVTQGLASTVIKQDLLKNLQHPDDYVIVNYKRGVLQQAGGGHISPIGAYHQASDSFLIMDVTPNKADWVWVKAELLFNAMRTFDTVENRGYLLVSAGNK